MGVRPERTLRLALYVYRIGPSGLGLEVEAVTTAQLTKLLREWTLLSTHPHPPGSSLALHTQCLVLMLFTSAPSQPSYPAHPLPLPSRQTP